ncbi:MAG: hypothetical protein LBO05_14260 [Deltaproteobacteria bacterium]|nr:hypothetical protein [Deltaproteobacteria bacterium]
MPPKLFKPAFRGSWVLVLGCVLGPAIALAGRRQGDAAWPWVLMTVVFAALLAHRLGLSYVRTETTLTVRSWWGLGRPESVTVADIDRARVFRSLAMRLAGCGHVLVHSARPDEGSLTLVALPDPDSVAAGLESLGRPPVDGPDGDDGDDAGDGGC